MSQFVEVKTAELTGPALDWAVASATGEVLSGESIQADHILVGAGVDGDLQRKFSPSTDWAQGGPLIEQENLTIERNQQMRGCAVIGFCEWHVTHPKNYGGLIRYHGEGPTVLIAACRAIVAAKLGDVVQVPAELVEVAS